MIFKFNASQYMAPLYEVTYYVDLYGNTVSSVTSAGNTGNYYWQFSHSTKTVEWRIKCHDDWQTWGNISTGSAQKVYQLITDAIFELEMLA